MIRINVKKKLKMLVKIRERKIVKEEDLIVNRNCICSYVKQERLYHVL